MNSVQLRDGTQLPVRPIGPKDKPLLREGFAELSDGSRYRRFFTPMVRLDDVLLAYLTDVDHSDHEALVALEPLGGRMAAVARFVRFSPGGATAEVAITVADRWQGRGLGTVLVEALVQRAREAGVEQLVAYVKADNLPAVRLFLGAGESELEAQGDEFQITIHLNRTAGERLTDGPVAAPPERLAA